MKQLFFRLLLNIIYISTIYSCSFLKKENKEIVSMTTPEELGDTNEVYEEAIFPYKAAKTILTDLIHTKLEIEPIWKTAELNGKATLTLKPHFYATDSVFIDAKGMEIKSVGNGKVNFPYVYINDKLSIKLDKSFTRNEKFNLEIDYIARPENYKKEKGEEISNNKGLFFINPNKEDSTVMPQIWTQGETETNSIWFPTIDAPNVKSTQELFITVEDKFVTLSNGKLIHQTKHKNGTRTDYWKQDLPHAPYLFMFAVGEFKIVKDTYTKQNGQKIDVNYYVEPEWEASAKAIFGETPAMIDYFSKLLGVEFPWDKYHQIVVRDYISGAMENTGAVVFGDFVYKNDKELLDDNDQSIIAHELFHHWFGDLVTCESWANLPLNESFANYAEYLWNEYKYGKDVADYELDKSTNEYFQEFDNGTNHSLIWYNYNDPENMFDRHSYNKGGRVLHMLRSYVGDEAFFLGLNHYLTQNQFKSAEIDNLRLAFEEVTGEDLHWFFDQWFFNKGIPQLSIEYYNSLKNKEIVLTVTQQQDLTQNPLYKLPVEVAVYDDAGEHIYKGLVDDIENKLVFPVIGNLKAVVFDHKKSLLAYYDDKKPSEYYKNQYYLHKTFISRYEALLNAPEQESPAYRQLIIDALTDPFWLIRQTAIEKTTYLDELNRFKAMDIIKEMALKDSNSSVRSNALQFFMDQNERITLKQLLKESLAQEKSYITLQKATNLAIQLSPETAEEVLKPLKTSIDNKTILMLTGVLALSQDVTHLDYFLKLIKENRFKGYDALELLNNFTYFISTLSIENQVKALEVYKKYKEEGNYYATMYLSQNVFYLIQAIESKEQTEEILLKLKEEYLKQLNDFYKTLEIKEKK
ncbi:MAG: M1 family metallopeptidase [Crocinitomicaceae bacterium]|jgi:aminopeptidase N